VGEVWFEIDSFSMLYNVAADGMALFGVVELLARMSKIWCRGISGADCLDGCCQSRAHSELSGEFAGSLARIGWRSRHDAGESVSPTEVVASVGCMWWRRRMHWQLCVLLTWWCPELRGCV
jgi:hypothetical protein